MILSALAAAVVATQVPPSGSTAPPNPWIQKELKLSGAPGPAPIAKDLKMGPAGAAPVRPLPVAGTPGAVTREAPMPNLYRQPTYCQQVVEEEVRRQGAYFKVGGARMAQYAVLRELDGCSVPTPVGYHPGLDPGVATGSPPDPAKREDAPSNRR